jgi:hypothetical protein
VAVVTNKASAVELNEDFCSILLLSDEYLLDRST